MSTTEARSWLGRAPNVVVTSLAATTSVAGDVAGTWKALLAGESGIGLLDDSFVEEFDLPVRIGAHLKVSPDDALTRVEIRRMSWPARVALTLARTAWTDAGSPDVDKDRLAVVIGTGLGGGDALIDAVDRLRTGGYRKVSPFAVQMVMPNGPSATVGLELGARGGVMTPVSACSSGAEAIAQAYRMIAMGDADMVVAGGVEGRIDSFSIASFATMRALSSNNADPAGASRPFDKDRDGFVFGEAGALMVLETEKHALARGATIHARLLGCGTTSDGYHLVAPDPTGRGAARAMTHAIQRAGLTPADITHINAHATATPAGDIAEAQAITTAVGTHAAIYAPKSALGHSVGAVGALEAVLTVLAVRDGVIPPTLNLDTLDPRIDLDVVTTSPRIGPVDYAVNNSFGFGGHNTALVFARP
ncbi:MULTISPECIES: KasA/KasB family beta-ketoacyl-ACP synthase [Rhodococcus]|uniref:Beta-ketoacyl-ACP synthase n=1 Tax=Rhodococcus erythropolis TaxID=1833 RepID=A0A8I1D980_RHOER|nr:MULTISPECIES: KasA/KasB family beta-ketoacyl-ACP synthase [Rhodococcus]MBH5145529.1 beta-ketoacyl-ACP synthase [Rhodococcus erythropolis]MCZ4618292.1 KasA/KasB family beta-ketoacyl-ACP synthase [Rhodococcus qingshengii]MDV8015134.1 KasA/KasB family beta-ketoacyl-ACP synthase [Rhodococcus sp. IEGM 1241]ORI16432.1 beta-ketoacyl-[acyl-carrier-protein] synthase II [Rhodococcus erythropolis]